MKKAILILSMLFILCITVPVSEGAVWSSDINLSNDIGYSWRPSIATAGDTVHVVWSESNDWMGYSSYQIYYKKGTDNGATWQDRVALSCTESRADNPEIAVYGNDVYVIWEDTGSLFIVHSPDLGQHWSAPRILSNNCSGGYVTVAASSELVFVAWSEWFEGMSKVAYSTSGDGSNWGAVKYLENGNQTSYFPYAKVIGQAIHMVYEGSRGYPDWIYYMRSEDAGVSWSSEMQIPGSAGFTAMRARLATDGQILHLVAQKQDSALEDYHVICSQSSDGGATWSDAIDVSHASGDHPDISCNNDNVYIVYNASYPSNIVLSSSDNNGQTWSEPMQLTHGTEGSLYPRISTNQRGNHLVWFDFRDGSQAQYNSEIYYKNFLEEKIDSEPPTISCSSVDDCGVYLAGPREFIFYATDEQGGSGLKSCIATLNGIELSQSPCVLDLEAGVYNLSINAEDNAGNKSSQEIMFIVYDPTAGFVTGGGWIDSQAGSYTADTSLAGKATFGFVSKYKKGTTVPEGNTQFQFKTGDLNFNSTIYDWLVVAGVQAKYKGSGTINGKGDYTFMLTAVDGQINGGGGIDKFRIKIWDKASGVTIYDNKMGASDASYEATAVSGGSIVIHK